MRMVGLAVVVALAGCAGQGPERRPDVSRDAQLVGSIQLVDESSVMVREDDDAPAVLLARGEDATVVRDGEEIGWGELAEGDQIRVFYTERLAGPSVVDRVEVIGEGTKGKPGETAREPEPTRPDPIPGGAAPPGRDPMEPTTPVDPVPSDPRTPPVPGTP